MLSSEYKFSVLIVDDEDHARLGNQLMITRLLKSFDSSEVNIKLSGTVEEMYKHLKADQFHLVLIDRDLGKDSKNRMIDGIDHIPKILEIQPTTKVIMVTAFKEPELAVKALKNGAMDFIVKGEKPHEVEYRNKQILKALYDSRLELRNLQMSIESGVSTEDYVCKSPAMRSVENQLVALSYAPTPVLILGQSGLGKTHAAKRLNELSKVAHKQSKRAFANINISSIPENLVESELFGHERGAFTGAKSRKQGIFEKAAGGDLFLDEIGDASPATQVKLLKVIDERIFMRVGGTEELQSNVRLIFATNKNLALMVEDGTFREDLYARICGFTIEMPSLKNRKEDIPQICQNITDRLSKEGQKKISYEDFPDLLKKYFVNNDFPYNIRGIKSDLERLLIYCPVRPNGKIDYSSWRTILSSISKVKKPRVSTVAIDDVLDQLVDKMGKDDWPGLKRVEEMLEEKLCRKLVMEVDSNKERAKILGMSESNTCTRIKKFERLRKLELKA